VFLSPLLDRDLIHDIIRNPLENSLSLKENRQRKQFKKVKLLPCVTDLSQCASYDLLKVGLSAEN